MPYRDPKSPFWFISYTAPSGKRIRVSSGTADKKEAVALEGKRRLESHRATQWGEKPKRPFDDVMLTYLRANEAKRSHDRDLTSAKALQPYFTGRNIEALIAEDIAGYKTYRRAMILTKLDRKSGEMRQVPTSDATIAKEMQLASAAINWGNTELDWALPNPFAKRIPKADEGKIRWLRREEATKLMAQARKSTRAPHLIDFIELSLDTGLRRDEALELEWDRVDFGQRLIYLEVEDQKGKRNSSVPLNEGALAVLRRRLELRRSVAARTRGKESPWVFANADGERIGAIKHSFYYAANKAGLFDVTPHTLRHTFAAWLVQAGVPLRTVCELCRHKDIRTTMRYAHLAPENGREAIKVLDRLAEIGQSAEETGSAKQA